METLVETTAADKQKEYQKLLQNVLNNDCFWLDGSLFMFDISKRAVAPEDLIEKYFERHVGALVVKRDETYIFAVKSGDLLGLLHLVAPSAKGTHNQVVVNQTDYAFAEKIVAAATRL